MRIALIATRRKNEGRAPGHRVAGATGTTELRIGPVLRDPYQAAADAGFQDDEVAFVSSMYE